MSRSRVIYTDEHPYHVTARSNNKDWFDVPMDYCFGVYKNVLEESIRKFEIKLHAFVLMNNHFHMIVSTPKKNISEFLKYFMTQTSKAISRKSNRINHIYGGRNHKSVIITPEYYAHCLKYVLRNPVSAGICMKVEDYRWSTASKVKNKMQTLLSPVETGHDEYIPDNQNDALEWFNESVPRELEDVLKKAMRHTIFEAKSSQKTKKRVDLNRWLYDQSQY